MQEQEINEVKELIQQLPVSLSSKYQFALSSTSEKGGWEPIGKLTKAELIAQIEMGLKKYESVNLSWIPNSFRPYSTGLALEKLGFLNMVYLDFDVEKDGKNKALEQPRILHYFESIDFTPTHIIDSGHGFYLYWLLQDGLKVTSDNLWAVKRMSEGLKVVVRKMKGAGFDYVDTNVTNLNHSMRLPGSYNFKNEKDIRQVKIVWQSTVTYKYKELYDKLCGFARNKKEHRQFSVVHKGDSHNRRFTKRFRKKKKSSKKNQNLVNNGKQHNAEQNKLMLSDFIMLSDLRGLKIDGYRHIIMMQAYIRGANDLSKFNKKLSYPLNKSEVDGLQMSMDNYQQKGKLYQPKKADTLVQELSLNEEEIRFMSVLIPKELAIKRATFRVKLKQLSKIELKNKVKLCKVLVVQKSRTLSAKKLAKQLNVSPRTVQGDKKLDIDELAKRTMTASCATLCLINKAIKEGVIDADKMKQKMDFSNQNVELIKNSTKKELLNKLKDYKKVSFDAAPF